MSMHGHGLFIDRPHICVRGMAASAELCPVARPAHGRRRPASELIIAMHVHCAFSHSCMPYCARVHMDAETLQGLVHMFTGPALQARDLERGQL